MLPYFLPVVFLVMASGSSLVPNHATTRSGIYYRWEDAPQDGGVWQLCWWMGQADIIMTCWNCFHSAISFHGRNEIKVPSVWIRNGLAGKGFVYSCLYIDETNYFIVRALINTQNAGSNYMQTLSNWAAWLGVQDKHTLSACYADDSAWSVGNIKLQTTV